MCTPFVTFGVVYLNCNCLMMLQLFNKLQAKGDIELSNQQNHKRTRIVQLGTVIRKKESALKVQY